MSVKQQWCGVCNGWFDHGTWQHGEVGSSFAVPQCSALVALKELRDAITDFGGVPGFIDRAVAYGVIRQADEVLKREMPNDGAKERCL